MPRDYQGRKGITTITTLSGVINSDHEKKVALLLPVGLREESGTHVIHFGVS